MKKIKEFIIDKDITGYNEDMLDTVIDYITNLQDTAIYEKWYQSMQTFYDDIMTILEGIKEYHFEMCFMPIYKEFKKWYIRQRYMDSIKDIIELCKQYDCYNCPLGMGDDCRLITSPTCWDV